MRRGPRADPALRIVVAARTMYMGVRQMLDEAENTGRLVARTYGTTSRAPYNGPALLALSRQPDTPDGTATQHGWVDGERAVALDDRQQVPARSHRVERSSRRRARASSSGRRMLLGIASRLGIDPAAF